MLLESIIIISLLTIILIFLIYLIFTKDKKNDTNDAPPLVIQTHLSNLQQAIQNSSQTLTQINTILLSPLQRGKLGNTQLEHLLSLYFPNDGKAFQLEYRLKKPTGKGGFLIADAFLFGLENKNNLAVDSKFPLENYLLLNNQSISELERQAAEKNFKHNLKEHIKKVSEYISEEDHCPHALIFFPSEAIFAKIQEKDYESIRQYALEKKVSLCSPITLAIIINQILWATKTWAEYRNLDIVLLELRKFWEEMVRFQDRWEKIRENVLKNNKLTADFDITVGKIIKQAEGIKKHEQKIEKKSEDEPIIA